MRSVTSEKEAKKKQSGTILLAAAAVLVIAGAVFTCARMSIINIPGITPTSASDNIIEVAYLAPDTEFTQGSAVDGAGAVVYRPVNMDELEAAGDTLPEDVVTRGDSLQDKVLRVGLKSGTMLTESMLADKAEDYGVDNNARIYEFDFINLDAGLQPGDVVDVRYFEWDITNAGTLKRNEVVVSKKIVQDISNKGIVTLQLSANELTLLRAAAVEMAAVNDKTKDTNQVAELSMGRYTLPTLQNAAIVNYQSSDADRINGSDPNQQPQN